MYSLLCTLPIGSGEHFILHWMLSLYSEVWEHLEAIDI